MDEQTFLREFPDGRLSEYRVAMHRGSWAYFRRECCSTGKPKTRWHVMHKLEIDALFDQCHMIWTDLDMAFESKLLRENKDGK